MKSILLPVENHALAESCLKTAWQIAQRCDSQVSAYALRPVHYQVVGAEPIVAVTFPPSEQEDGEAYEGAKRHFDRFVAAHPATGGAVMKWATTSPIDDNQISSISRIFDLTVVGRPAHTGEGPRMTTLEAALFDSGRPILVAPPKPRTTFGTNVVISWNQSMESAHTVAFGIGLLKQADKDLKALDTLGDDFNGKKIWGDVLDINVLEDAGIKEADAIFLLTGNDNLNLVVGKVAKRKYEVKKIVMQVNDVGKKQLFQEEGLTIVNRTYLIVEVLKKCMS